jgi:hypothetical protein
MSEKTIPQTAAELDSLIVAMGSGNVMDAARKLIWAAEYETKLPNGYQDMGWYPLLIDAVASGIKVDDLVDFFGGQEQESRARAEKAKSRMAEVDILLGAHRRALQADDGKLCAILRAIESIRLAAQVAARSSRIAPDRANDLRAAAAAAGVDPAEIEKLIPPAKIESLESEAIRMYYFSLAEKPIRAVLADPLRRTGDLPAWVISVLSSVERPPEDRDSAAWRQYQKSVRDLVSEHAAAHQ